MNNPNMHQQPQAYDASETPSNIEGFEDEPTHQHDPYNQQPQHDPYQQPGQPQPQYSQNGQPQQYAPRQPREQAPEPRKHKYSTANMNETSNWKKWCSILALFLLFLAFMIGMSILFNHFFFSDQSDNGPQVMQRPENATFSKDKQDIDTACSKGTFSMDQGELCKEACAPQFFECCDPFDEFDLYNFTEIASNDTTAEVEKNVTFLDEFDFDESQCSFDKDLRGCMSYAKCQALGGQVDPAPANLPDICALDRLEKDDDGCKDLCKKLDCCYSPDSDNCLAEKFDLCMDYAPCQNLRALDGNTIIETAPRTLDFDCYWQQPACGETCEQASCCGDPSSTCFQNNFMACLTYSPCTNVTEVNVVVAPQFGHVKKPPNEIVYACNAKDEEVLEPTPKTCNEYCAIAACCWDADQNKNCFHKDPLGCLAWDAQCQMLLDQ